MILGPYGFNSFREVSLTKLWKQGGWEVNKSTGKLEKVKMDFQAIQANNRRNKDKVREKNKTKKQQFFKDLLKSKFGKESELHQNRLVNKIRDRGMDVISCGLGIDLSVSEGQFCSRRGIFGHLNFYPRWIGGLSNGKSFQLKSNFRLINERKFSEDDDNSSDDNSEDFNLHTFGPDQHIFELTLIQKFIMNNRGKLNLFFEEGRLLQMASQNINDPQAFRLFAEGANKHFYHNCVAEVIKEKLSRIIHENSEKEDYTEILE